MEINVLALDRNLSATDRREFFQMVLASWALTVATVAAGLVMCEASHIKFLSAHIPLNLVVAGSSLAIFLLYALFRNDFFVVSVSSAVATISAFTSPALVFCYAAVHFGSSFPLWNANLASIDELVFGLDWLSFFQWAAAHQAAVGVLFCAYASFGLQAIAAVVILSALGDYRRLQTLILAFQLSLLCCAIIAIFTPAIDQYAYRHIDTTTEFQWVPDTATAYIADFIQLRGTNPLVSFDDMQGVITFPSFHAVLALLLSWAFWKTPVFRWIALALNAAMILSTPICGGHYFIDIPAGLFVAVVSLQAASRIVLYVRSRIDRRPSIQNLNPSPTY